MRYPQEQLWIILDEHKKSFPNGKTEVIELPVFHLKDLFRKNEAGQTVDAIGIRE
jgi:hypothetical protein